MRKNAEKVLQAFSESIPLSCGSISTDGKKLFSYKMLIADTEEDGGIALVEYDCAPSATTRSHVRAAERFFSSRSINRRFRP